MGGICKFKSRPKKHSAYLAVYCFFLPFLFSAQGTEQKFLQHLLDNKFYQEAILYLKSSEYGKLNDPAKNFTLARCFRQTGQTENYIQSLQAIDLANPYFHSARLWQQNYFLQKEQKSQLLAAFFDEQNCPDSVLHLQRLNQAALYGLNHDLPAFLSVKQTALDKKTPYVQHFSEMENALRKINAYKKRKPFIAGLLSVFVPGLGKVYAQKPRQGFSSFMTVGIFALQTIEMYKKGKGFRNPGFYFYGSVFTAFYLGNIIGSAHAAKKRNYDYIREQEYELLRQADYPYRRPGF